MDPEDNDSVRHRARLMSQLIQRVICDMFERGPLALVAGEEFEPSTSGL